MWNTNTYRHRINNATEGWNFKLNSITAKQQPYIILPVEKLKKEAELVLWQLKSKKLGQPGQKRKKRYIQQDERIKRIMEEFGILNDLYKSLKALSYKIRVNNVLIINNTGNVRIT
jgi:hypothetical protein